MILQHSELLMEEGNHFIGAGDTGCMVAAELCRIYKGMREGLFQAEQDRPHNHLHIHCYPCAAKVCFDDKDHLVILGGSLSEPDLRDARDAFRDKHPYLMSTVATDYRKVMNTGGYRALPDECLIFPDAVHCAPVKLAQLVLQIFLIHTPWYISTRGSLVGYDLADTKAIFAGKTAKVITMTSDKVHYKKHFLKLLNTHRSGLGQTQGVLASFWGLDLRDMNNLRLKVSRLLTDADVVFTLHDLPDDESHIKATLFYTL